MSSTGNRPTFGADTLLAALGVEEPAIEPAAARHYLARSVPEPATESSQPIDTAWDHFRLAAQLIAEGDRPRLLSEAYVAANHKDPSFTAAVLAGLACSIVADYHRQRGVAENRPSP